MSESPALNIKKDLLIFFLAIGLVIIAQFWYDAIIELYKKVFKRETEWYHYLIASLIASVIFLIFLYFVFKVSVSSII